MKLKGDFVLREIAGSFVVVSAGQTSKDRPVLIRLNETGAVLWKALADGADERALADALIQQYDVDGQTALEDVRAFVSTLSEKGIVEPDKMT